MRINFVCPPLNSSGGLKVVAIYAAELVKRGHAVKVISHRAPADRPTGYELDPSHFSARNVPFVIQESESLVPDRFPDADVSIATWWATARAVDDSPRTKGVGIHFIQGWEIFPGQPVRSVIEAWQRPLAKLVISKKLYRIATEEFGFRDARHVPNGVDTEQFFATKRGKQAAPTVGYLHTSSTVKGIDVCLATLKQLRQKFPQLRVLALSAKAPCDKYPVLEGTELWQSPPQRRIRELYQQCDLWLCGSRSEGFHLPPLEAMACRTPVVSTAVGGPVDIIDPGRNGFLAPIEDVPALSEHSAHVLSLSGRAWQQLSDGAHATAQRHDWRRATDAFEAALLHWVQTR